MGASIPDQCRIFRLAAVATHPIQYQAPLWKALQQSGQVELKVFYASDHGIREHGDPLYGHTFAWDIPLLDGYNHEFLESTEIPFFPGPVANRYPRGLLQKLRGGAFDAVLIHGYMTAAAWAGYRAARKLNIPILLRGDSHLKQTRGSVRSAAKSLLLRRFLSGVAFCLAVGQWNRDYWIRYGVPSERIATTLYAIDNHRFSESATENVNYAQALRKSWGAMSQDTVFVFSGNFQEHKGIDLLIDAYARLRANRRDVHLTLIGTGPLERDLRRRASEIASVHWLGFVNQTQMPASLRAADVFVLPSRIEPWGLVVNEAMACGLPPIVSDAVGAGPDLVSGPRVGRIVPVNDVEKLAEAMNDACDPMLRAEWKTRIGPILRLASFDKNVETIAGCLSQLPAPVRKAID